MASLTRTLRPVLRTVYNQVRNYAEASGNEMKFTLAGANQVFLFFFSFFVHQFHYFFSQKHPPNNINQQKQHKND